MPSALRKPARLMIIDDSTSARRVFERMMADSLEIEVVASVGDAAEAIKQIPNVKPDVITLDVEMPGLGGIEALQEILAVEPNAKVIMLSALTLAGSKATTEALRLGAKDVLTKPGLGVSAADFKSKLCAMVAALNRG
jgi:two-component system, chemotaxis family, protein-glutamate methylesterase/glutaminase